MPQSRASTVPPSLIRLVLIGATVLTLISSAQHWAVMQLDTVPLSWRTVWHALSKEAPVWFLWAAAAPLVHLAIRRFPFRAGSLLVAVPAHVALALALAVAHEALVLAVHWLLGFPTPPGPFWAAFVNVVPYRLGFALLSYGVLLGGVVATDYYTRLRSEQIAAAAVGRQLAEARLQALRMQLNPHFLFNAMNTIAMLVRRKADTAAVEMLAGLSEILRHVLVESPPQETSLREEITFTKRYLSIEQARFGDRLTVSIDIDPEVEEALVPTLVLQPLVENAIHHGVGRRAAPGWIEISARGMGDDLELCVADDGPGPDGKAEARTPASGVRPASSGIGLRNTRDRLARHYGDRGTFELVARPEGGAISRVVLPLRQTHQTLELEAVAAG